MADLMSYYDKAGKPLSFDEFAALKYDANGDISDYARIAYDQLEHCALSTVWLGLNHSFTDGPPILFESMIFGGPHDGDMRRYATEDDALAGHLHAVDEIRAGRLPW